jgi:hypothetical protein
MNFQGCHLRYAPRKIVTMSEKLTSNRQAHQPGYQPAQVPALPQVHRRGACRPPLRQLARPQLVLDQPGLDVQVLRSHPRRPPAQGHPPRSPYQLDRQACPQAPREPWSHRHWQEVAWSRPWPQVQQHHRWQEEDLEEAQHPLPLALPLDALRVWRVWWQSVWSKFSSEWAGVNGKGYPGLCSCLA